MRVAKSGFLVARSLAILLVFASLRLEKATGLATPLERSFPAGGQTQAQNPALEGFDAFVTQIMKDWKVPGLAVAVVQDGKIIHMKGYGLRDVQKSLPVTSRTLFAIGSITKSVTVSAMGMLVDEGKLDWDAPVRNTLPGFKLYDPVASERMTPRDLVTHRSGLPRHDLLWYSSDFSRAEMVRRLQYLEPSKDFRSAYQYNNLMFMTAGFLAAQLAGTTWEELVRQRILLPLGMRDTNFSVLDSQKSDDFALPYQNAKGELKRIPFYVLGAVGPAGEINSNVEDLAQYLMFHLSKGKHGEARLLSETNAMQMQIPQMVAPNPERYKELGPTSYGLGFLVSTYRGHKIVSHGGAIDGFAAQLAFLSQDNIGVVALANLNADKDPVPTIVVYNLIDRLLGLDKVPWSQRFKDDEQKTKESEEEAKKKGFTIRKPNTHPSHDLKDYAGEYESPAYGIVKVALEKEDLRLSFNRLSSPLRHFHYDVFEVAENPLDPLEKSKVMFSTDVKGDIASLSIPLEPHVKDIVFTRMPERAMLEKSFLEPLAGKYEIGGRTVTVALEGEKTLVLVIPGQPQYELIPRHGTLFDLKGLSGFSIEFKKDASGAVTEAVFYQPDGTYVAKKK